MERSFQLSPFSHKHPEKNKLYIAYISIWILPWRIKLSLHTHPESKNGFPLFFNVIAGTERVSTRAERRPCLKHEMFSNLVISWGADGAGILSQQVAEEERMQQLFCIPGNRHTRVSARHKNDETHAIFIGISVPSPQHIFKNIRVALTALLGQKAFFSLYKFKRFSFFAQWLGPMAPAAQICCQFVFIYTHFLQPATSLVCWGLLSSDNVAQRSQSVIQWNVESEYTHHCQKFWKEVTKNHESLFGETVSVHSISKMVKPWLSKNFKLRSVYPQFGWNQPVGVQCWAWSEALWEAPAFPFDCPYTHHPKCFSPFRISHPTCTHTCYFAMSHPVCKICHPEQTLKDIWA